MSTHTHLNDGDTATVDRKSKIKIQAALTRLGQFNMIHSYAQEKVAVEAPHATTTLLRLLARVELENQLYFSATQFSRLLNIPRSTLESHFNQLRELGVIVPDPKQEDRARGIVLWRVCPFLVWVGTGDNMRKYLKTLPPDHSFFNYLDPEFRDNV